MKFYFSVDMDELNLFLRACKKDVFNNIIKEVHIEPSSDKGERGKEFYVIITLKGMKNDFLQPEEIFEKQMLFLSGLEIGQQFPKKDMNDFLEPEEIREKQMLFLSGLEIGQQIAKPIK